MNNKPKDVFDDLEEIEWYSEEELQNISDVSKTKNNYD